MERQVRDITESFLREFIPANVPDEADLVQTACTEYFRYQAEHGRKARDAAPGLGFSGPEMMVFVTPIVVQVIAATIRMLLDRWFDSRKSHIPEKEIREAILNSSGELDPTLAKRLASEFVVYLKANPDLLAR